MRLSSRKCVGRWGARGRRGAGDTVATTDYTFDSFGRLTEIDSADSGDTTIVDFVRAYNHNGNPKVHRVSPQDDAERTVRHADGGQLQGDVAMRANWGHATAAEKKEISELEARVAERPDDWDAVKRLGQLMYEPVHDHDACVRLLRSVLVHRPDDTEARLWLADCLLTMDPQAAKEEADAALAREPERADVLMLMAAVLEEPGANAQQIMECLERAARIQPDWPQPRCLLAFYFVQIGDFDRAEEEIQAARAVIRKNPELPPLGSVEAYYEEIYTGRATSDKKLLWLERLERQIAEERRRGKPERPA